MLSPDYIIDAHVHLDCSSRDLLATDRERYGRFMDEVGLDAALVMAKSTDTIDFYPEHERLLELGQIDERIFPIINFDTPRADDSCLESTEEWLTEELAVAVKIYPGYDPFYPHEHPRALELASMLERLGKPLIVHCGDTVVPDGLLKYAHPLHLDDLAVRFPTLKIVMAHIGNPFFDAAQAVIYKNANVFADGSGMFMSRSDEFVYDPYVDELIRRLRFLYAYIDSVESIHFGGDFPFTSPWHHVEFWMHAARRLDFTDDERHLLFYENARTVFDLPLPDVTEG